MKHNKRNLRIWMFRVIAVLLAFAGLVQTGNLMAFAEDYTEVIYIEDGSYFVVEVYDIQTRTGNSVTGTKTVKYNSNSGELLWKAVLRGIFTYDGSSADCTSSVCNVTIYDDGWYVVSKKTATSGASATCALTMGNKLLGVTVNKVSYNIKLTCDKNGNLS